MEQSDHKYGTIFQTNLKYANPRKCRIQYVMHPLGKIHWQLANYVQNTDAPVYTLAEGTNLIKLMIKVI